MTPAVARRAARRLVLETIDGLKSFIEINEGDLPIKGDDVSYAAFVDEFDRLRGIAEKAVIKAQKAPSRPVIKAQKAPSRPASKKPLIPKSHRWNFYA